MFSKRSVRVQPSAPPTENARVPDARSVFAAEISSVQVFGADTPAAVNAGTLYQSNDLLAALKTSAYCLPLTDPSCDQAGAKFAASTDVRVVDRLQVTLLGELLDEAGLRNVSHVGRMAARDRRSPALSRCCSRRACS